MTIQRMGELLEIERECVLRNASGECNRYCAECDLLQDDTELHEMYTDVLAMLKEQEPKLLTIEDFTPEKLRDIHHVWVEIRPGYYNADLDRCYGGKPYPAVVTRWSGIRCNSIGNVCQVWIPGGYESLFNVNNDYNTGYGVKWRCWTSRPTDEQREAIPWE